MRAYRENIDGREQTIHVKHAGGTLAEVAVFDRGPYPSSAVADEDSEVLFLATEDVHRFLLRYPQAALAALTNMAKKLRVVASLAEQLALKDVGQRLATLLLEEARRTAPKLRDGIHSLYLCRTRNLHHVLDQCGKWSRAHCRGWCNRVLSSHEATGS